MLDAVSPKKTIKQIVKPKNPWFNKYIRQQRKVVKKESMVKVKARSPMAQIKEAKHLQQTPKIL